MEEVFSETLLGHWAEEMNIAAGRIEDMLSITPPSLIKEAANFLGGIYFDVKRACDLLSWVLVAEVSVDFQNGLGYQRVSHELAMSTPPRSFKIEWKAKFYWGSGDKHHESALFPISDLIEALRSKTLFGDVVIFTALRDLFLRVLNLYYNLIPFLETEIRSRFGADGWFLFDRARYHQSIENITAQNKNIELKKDKNVLEEVAVGLEESKHFTKSKLLAMLREKCEKRVHELNFVIPG